MGYALRRTQECQFTNRIGVLCLHVPLALEKVEGPSTTISFLGILLDTVRMEIRLPEDKLVRIKDTLSTWLEKKKATKREILSLVGLLQHATKAVRCGRTFVGRMYAAAATKVKKNCTFLQG